MEKEFVPYTEALALKKLGFDEPCFVGYSTSTEKLEYYSRPIVTKDSFTVDSPTYSQAFRWFRENHKLGHMINGIGYESFLMNIGGIITVFPMFKTYEEAELACLIKLIEIVKTFNSK
jgi:hypothetical protein